MIIISNTTPLIGLAMVQHFDLLNDLFGEIYIAEAVYTELTQSQAQTSFGKKEVIQASWIKRCEINDRFSVDVLLDELDLGEAETIVLAHELKADWVLMDERKGRRKLTQLGFAKIGTGGLLLKAKQAGFIAELKPNLERLRREGFSISQTVIDALLAEAKE